MRRLKPIKPLLDLWKMMTPAIRKRFVLVLKTSPGTARQYAEGRRGISPAVAIRIEKATGMLGTGYPKLSRMDLNETCRGCEFAIACSGRQAVVPVPKAHRAKKITLPRNRKGT